ncbi:hypothetical protein [Bacillus sp. AK031]
MQTFLIFISFILNIAALLAIVILYTRQNRLLEVEKKQERTVKEMEDTISAYLLELKEDNDRFIQQFQTLKENNTEQSREKVEKIRQAAELDSGAGNSFQDQEESPETYSSQSFKRQNAAKAYKKIHMNSSKPDADHVLPVDEASSKDPIYSKIKNLQDDGYSLDEIAQELGKGVTEIELLLKFRQNHK